MKKFKLLLLAFFFLFAVTLTAIAIDSDYKNNLLKVDVSKVTDGNYRITLFTQNPYAEPFKIVKKSDTEYYLLLPETYHSITSAPTPPDENIRSIQIKLFPYLGQDLNNGYTRVNIQTASPLNFSTAVRTAQTTTVPRVAQAQLDKIIQEKPAQVKSTPQPHTEVPKQIQVKPVQVQPSYQAANTPKQQPKAKIINVPQKPQQVVTKNNTIETKKPLPQPQKPLTDKKVTSPLQTTQPAAKTIVARKPSQEITKEELPKLETMTDESVAPFLPADIEEKISDSETLDLPEELESEPVTSEDASSKFDFNPSQAINAAIAILLIWLMFILAKSRKRKIRKVKLTQRSEIGGDYVEKTQTAVDKPELANGGIPPYVSAYTQPAAEFQEMNIAQEFEADLDEYEKQIVDAQMQLEPEEEKPEEIYAQPAEETVTEEGASQEPAILASAQIENGKWLYLINYEDTIALVGIVGDEFTIIKQFKTVENNEIQYRLSEQREGANYYIVKVDSFKALVKVSANEISLKIEL